MVTLLKFIILFPVIGAVGLLGLKGLGLLKTDSDAIAWGIGISGITFIATVFLWVLFDRSDPGFQGLSTLFLNPLTGGNVLVGVDGIGLLLLVLTGLLTPICILCSRNSVKTRALEFVICFLVMESLLMGVFTVLDIMLFYILFEGVLIPMFLVIGVWGARERKIRASYQFFLYTLAGSLFMLLAMVFIYFESGTTDLTLLYTMEISEKRQLFLWLAFFSSFAVKVPMVPVHLWLPEAHVEAPTAGSVILAGILLKLGGYGLMRFSLPLFPEASVYFTPLVFAMSLLGVVYTGLTTLRQVDLKKIIAYSSVGHMGFVTLGLFTWTIQGLEGAYYLMLGHGIVSSALFLCIGVLYDRHHTRILKYYGGFAQHMPLFAFTFIFFTLANVGLPGTSNFVGEFLVMLGLFQANTFATFVAATGVIFSAAYGLWLANRLLFGQYSGIGPGGRSIAQYQDMNRREIMTFGPLILITLWMGIYPESFLGPVHGAVSLLLA